MNLPFPLIRDVRARLRSIVYHHGIKLVLLLNKCVVFLIKIFFGTCSIKHLEKPTSRPKYVNIEWNINIGDRCIQFNDEVTVLRNRVQP